MGLRRPENRVVIPLHSNGPTVSHEGRAGSEDRNRHGADRPPGERGSSRLFTKSSTTIRSRATSTSARAGFGPSSTTWGANSRISASARGPDLTPGGEGRRCGRGPNGVPARQTPLSRPETTPHGLPLTDKNGQTK